MTSRRPDLFIIGSAKSGTSSLYDYLSGHPEIFMSAIKEPFFFSPDIQGGARKRMSYPDGEAEYLALFDGARDERRLGEASTRYLVSRVAPVLVSEFQPAARIVAMLRNPVDMIYSLHNDRVSAGTEDIESFEEALEADNERLAGRRLRDNQTPEYAAYRTNAMYGEQLERWFERFPSEQIHVMVFDDFISDTPATFRKLLEFLDVDPEYTPAEFAVKRASHRRRGGLVGAVSGSRAAHVATRKLLPAVIGANRRDQLVWQFRNSRLLRRGHQRPPLPANVRRMLEADFANDVARLGQLLGRDLSLQWFGRSTSALNENSPQSTARA